MRVCGSNGNSSGAHESHAHKSIWNYHQFASQHSKSIEKIFTFARARMRERTHNKFKVSTWTFLNICTCKMCAAEENAVDDRISVFFFVFVVKTELLLSSDRMEFFKSKSRNFTFDSRFLELYSVHNKIEWENFHFIASHESWESNQSWRKNIVVRIPKSSSFFFVSLRILLMLYDALTPFLSLHSHTRAYTRARCTFKKDHIFRLKCICVPLLSCRRMQSTLNRSYQGHS